MITVDVTLETERLILRRIENGDVPALVRVTADREVALNTLTIPHPYGEEDARQFIERTRTSMSEGKSSLFAIVRKEDDELVGTVGLQIEPDHSRAELGYSLGVESWGKGYATEAARAVVDYGFESLGLDRIHACYFPRNPASGRVLEKLGFVEEGRLRRHIVKWGERLDTVLLAQLREEWESARAE